MKTWLLAFVTTMVTAAGATGAEQGVQKVALWRLRALGIAPQVVDTIRKVFEGELGRLDGVSLVDPSGVGRLLEDNPELAACTAQAECLARAGKLLGAELVIGAVVGLLDTDYSLDAKLVDVRTGRELRRITRSWQGTGDELVAAARELAVRLLRPEAYKGQLVVEANTDGVEIHVDGAMLGKTPLEGPLLLSPGVHAVRLQAEGYRAVERLVEVPFGQAVRLEVDLEPLRIAQHMELSRDTWQLGIAVGIVSNTGSLNSPQVAIEAGWFLPFWGERLSLVLRNRLWGTNQSGQLQLDGQGVHPFESWVLAWSPALLAVFRPLKGSVFTPVVAAGGCFSVAWQTLEAAPFPVQSFRESAWGFEVAAGAEYTLGPGALAFEAGYLHLRLEGYGEHGGIRGLIGGFSLFGGYRFIF
ncbi:MAG: PEGA domain-containing protein [Deltaproteobacteria bacterium]|nr:MAG: PEGA domain-containing protein [Deltaproteobacteria bacterium]